MLHPTKKIYSNLPYLNTNRDFTQDVANFAIQSGHRKTHRKYIPGKYVGGVYEQGYYDPNIRIPQQEIYFFYDFSMALFKKKNEITKSKEATQEKKDAIERVNVRCWTSCRHLLDRCSNGRYSPAIAVLVCETFDIPYKFVIGNIDSRRGAIEVQWIQKEKQDESTEA